MDINAFLCSSSSSKNAKITPKLRTQIWETYMGVGVRSDACPLCGVNQIQNYQSNSGFQACHVVADKWSLKELNVYYLYPGLFSVVLKIPSHAPRSGAWV
jgi:hypothetical protein